MALLDTLSPDHWSLKVGKDKKTVREPDEWVNLESVEIDRIWNSTINSFSI